MAEVAGRLEQQPADTLAIMAPPAAQMPAVPVLPKDQQKMTQFAEQPSAADIALMQQANSPKRPSMGPPPTLPPAGYNI